MKNIPDVVNFVSLPALEFGSYMLCKAQAVLIESLVIIMTVHFPMGHRILYHKKPWLDYVHTLVHLHKTEPDHLQKITVRKFVCVSDNYSQ